MADHDKGATPSGTTPPERKPGIATPAERTPGASTEWTVSDRRGPLDSAADADVERFVPAHEMDAEGGLDPAPAIGATGAMGHETRAENSPPETGISTGPEGVHGIVPEGATGASVHGVAHDEFTPDDFAHDGTMGSAHDDVAHDGIGEGSALGASHPADVPAAGSPPADRLAPKVERRSLWPVAAGVVIGAIIGAGSAALVSSQGSDDGASNERLAALTSRVDALDKRPDAGADIKGVKSSVADLQAKVGSLEKQAGASSGASGTALAAKVAAMQASLDAIGPKTSAAKTTAAKTPDANDDGLAKTVASLNEGVSNAQKSAASAQSALDGLKAGQTDLQTKVAGLTNAVAGALKQATSAETGLATLQGQQKDLQGQQKEMAGKLGAPALAVVADSLVQQIAAGAPFARQVEALKSLGADPAPIAVLGQNAEAGVPSAKTLLAKFKPLADPIVATGDKAPANAGFMDRMKHGLSGLVSVRRADETTGDDLPSRVALIQADLVHDDVPGAYDVWSKMPAEAKAKSQAWGALAKTSVESIEAAHGLQRDAIGALGGGKKS